MRGLSGPIVSLLLLLPALSAAERFEIVPRSEGTEVIFESKAPLESFEGKTPALSGILDLDPENLNDSIAIRVEIPLDSLDTGIGLRNRHMRENHLETDQFPTALFESIALVQPHPDRFIAGRNLAFEVEGNLTLHGVTRKVVLPVYVTRIDGDKGIQLQIESRFDINLSDYDIERPKFLVMKLSDTQKIHFRARAVKTKADGDR